MTNQLSIRSFDIPQIHRFGVGFERVFDRVEEILKLNSQQNVNYPPYNIILDDENNFTIEIAVAGFKEGEISIEVKDNQLTVTGQKVKESVGPVYYHSGISRKDFVRTFTLADYVEVLGASQNDGILTIKLQRLIPEEKKPKTIAITYQK